MKAFHQLLLNSMVVSVANNTVWFAVTFWVYLETQSVLATSLVGGIYLIATTLSGFGFGALVDHNRKKDVVLWSTVASLVCYVLAMVFLLITPESQFHAIASLPLWVFVVLLMLGVIPGNIRSIAVPTTVALLVPEDERDKANGLTGMLFGISFMCTSFISGFLLAYTGMFGVLIMALAASVIGIVHVLFISIPEKQILHTEDQQKKVDIIGTYKVVKAIPGLLALLLFATFNNFLGGVYMALMDAYGLTLVPVEIWGVMWGFVSLGFLVGGSIIAKKGLGPKPLRRMLLVNVVTWSLSILFPVQPWIILMAVCMFINMCLMPMVEAAEHTVIQKVVPQERMGRVFGFAQSVEWAATPLTTLMIGPIAEFIFIPYMTTGAGVQLIGGWFGTGPGRGMALVFILAGLVGLTITLLAFRTKSYRLLSEQYTTPSEGLENSVLR